MQVDPILTDRLESFVQRSMWALHERQQDSSDGVNKEEEYYMSAHKQGARAISAAVIAKFVKDHKRLQVALAGYTPSCFPRAAGNMTAW